MSTSVAVEVGDEVEPSAIITSSLCLDLAQQAKRASRKLAVAGGAAKDAWLKRSAVGDGRTAGGSPGGQRGGRRRRARARASDAAAIDRLRLDPKRVEEMARALRDVAALPDPIGETIAVEPAAQRAGRPAGPRAARRDLHDLREPAQRHGRRRGALRQERQRGDPPRRQGGASRPTGPCTASSPTSSFPCGLPEHAVQLVPTTDRAAVGELLGMPDYIDLAIPRGGESLIRRVVAEARMPVLKHYQGNCHVYVDARCDIDMGIRIVLNAKAQRPGVCNAAETLLVHRAVAPYFLPRAADALVGAGVELRGDPVARTFIPDMTPAEPADWDTEYLDKILAVAVVESLDEAIAHITRHGSGHTEAIVTQRPGRGPAVRRRGRQLGRDGQRQHAVQRRRPARPGRRDRHQHRQVPRPRPLRPPRADQHQVDRLRRRSHPRVTSSPHDRDAERPESPSYFFTGARS